MRINPSIRNVDIFCRGMSQECSADEVVYDGGPVESAHLQLTASTAMQSMMLNKYVLAKIMLMYVHGTYSTFQKCVVSVVRWTLDRDRGGEK